MNFVNYNLLDFQAIEVLERATRVRPVAPLFILLGKTNMKAKRFEDAIKSFGRAIEIMVCFVCSQVFFHNKRRTCFVPLICYELKIRNKKLCYETC